ncbi:MAG: YczE/YyaS/YitT family protein [Ilumatobacteraceae bacterium]
MPAVLLPLPSDRRAERLARCISGLALFGLGISLFLVAELGVAPWDVLHQGISRRTGVPIGVVIEITGVLLLLAWIPLRQRLGWGTLLNAAEIGLVVLLIGDRLPSTDAIVPRLGYVAAGLLAIGVGSGLYIGAGLGSGPRDGLMLGLAARGVSVRLARTAIEASVLVGGWALGGDIGLGTAVFALGIGPTVQFFLPLLRPRDVAVSTGSARA